MAFRTFAVHSSASTSQRICLLEQYDQLSFDSYSIIILLDLGTDLNEFISCPFNSAINRQTRMLSTIHPRCSSIQIDLESAKENLRSMEFFGLTEYLSLSQRLFERTSYCQIYRICSFQSYLEQDMQANQTSTYLREHLTSIDLKRLRDMNSDDVLLYDYAKELFFHRTCQILGVACQ